jgi:hypothetical protein
MKQRMTYIVGRIKRHEGRSGDLEQKSEVERNVGRMTESCRRSKDVRNYTEVKETK